MGITWLLEDILFICGQFSAICARAELVNFFELAIVISGNQTYSIVQARTNQNGLKSVETRTSRFSVLTERNAGSGDEIGSSSGMSSNSWGRLNDELEIYFPEFFHKMFSNKPESSCVVCRIIEL
jgi:hypothetical protein